VSQPVTITANAQGSGVQYKFFVGLYDWCASQSPNWVVVRDWNASNTASYTPTTQGRMIFFVWVASTISDPCTGFAAITYQAGQSGGGGGTGNLSVTVVDATNATPISGASLNFGGVSGSSSAQGTYTFSNAPAGTNTLTTSMNGYSNNTQSITLAAGENKQITVALSPVLSAGEMRIVLTWGATPSDLDSHLTGPDNAAARFHVYYSDKTPSGADANLDVDDTSSYGPETVTISERHSGTYKYYIHDYSNRSSSSTSAMAQSGARVQVYSGAGGLIATYNVPTSPGTLWYVFSMDGASGAITPQNQMSYESSPTGPSIQSADAELGIFQDLPEK